VGGNLLNAVLKQTGNERLMKEESVRGESALGDFSVSSSLPLTPAPFEFALFTIWNMITACHVHLEHNNR